MLLVTRMVSILLGSKPIDRLVRLIPLRFESKVATVISDAIGDHSDPVMICSVRRKASGVGAKGPRTAQGRRYTGHAMSVGSGQSVFKTHGHAAGVAEGIQTTIKDRSGRGGLSDCIGADGRWHG